MNLAYIGLNINLIHFKTGFQIIFSNFVLAFFLTLIHLKDNFWMGLKKSGFHWRNYFESSGMWNELKRGKSEVHPFIIRPKNRENFFPQFHRNYFLY